MQTSFEAQCDILCKIWTDYANDKDLEDFIEYNDIGLPLAYFISEKIALPTELAQTYIGETFEILLAALEIEDKGYKTLDDVFLESDR
jgi:hypothetical protein